MTDLFDFKPPRKKFAVMGNPIAHSKSPQIHSAFARQCDIDIEYDRIQVEQGGFDQAVSHFSAHRGAGLNVTVPFKVEAWNLCQRDGNSLTTRATIAESVNTLKFTEDGAVHGDNTDGYGIATDIQQNLQHSLDGARILVIGAGGAVRGVLAPLLECKPAALHIVNRTADKAILLGNRFTELGFANVSASAMERQQGDFDVIINGTAASLGGELPDISAASVGGQTLAYDMMYSPEPTLFMKWALDKGAARAADGLGMLVEQAAESFRIWHDKQPDTGPVINFLRKN